MKTKVRSEGSGTLSSTSEERRRSGGTRLGAGPILDRVAETLFAAEVAIRRLKQSRLGPIHLAGYVTGLRWKRFIPATTGGSGADIVVVTERWYSPELKIQLLARIIDPRAGDTSEVVTNRDRGEPDPSEFQIPADYKIETVVARGKQAERVPQQ